MSGDSFKNPFKGVSMHTPLGGSGGFFQKPFGDNSMPDAQAPPPPPDPRAATMTALQSQLNQELQMRRSSALVTGGEGLMADPTTKSAGQTLLGA